MAAKGITKDIPHSKGQPTKGHIALPEVVKRTGHARETLLKLCNTGVLQAERFGGWPGRIYVTRMSLTNAAEDGKMRPLAGRKGVVRSARVARKKTKKAAKKKPKSIGLLTKAKKDVAYPARRKVASFTPHGSNEIRDLRRAVAACLILNRGWAREAVEDFLDEVDEFETLLASID